MPDAPAVPGRDPRRLRNLALLGPAGAGKTTLTEALLHAAGAVARSGRVEDGDTVSDFTPEEKHHGHSLDAALLHAEHNGRLLQLIDTPGTPDLLGHALAVLPAVETAAVVVHAGRGVEPVARHAMAFAARRNLCRMVVVTHLDAADPVPLLTQLRDAFGRACLPLNLPADGGARVVDCFAQSDGDSDLGPVADHHTAIVEQVVELDDELMDTYLEQGDVLRPEQLHEPFEAALREGHLIPVVFTAARPESGGEPVGVRELLDVIATLCPDPTEGNPRPFVRGKVGDLDLDPTHEFHATPDPDAHVLAHVFHIRIDPYTGKRVVLRVHQGTVAPGGQLFVDDPEAGESKRPIKVPHLHRLQGAEAHEIDAAGPGEWVALMKTDELHFDAVLHDSHDEDHLHLRPLELPEPMASLALTPQRRGDEQKLADALQRLADEDPTCRVTRDPSTHETVVHGLGDLHLRAILEKLEHHHHVAVASKPPRVAYRETIRAAAKGHHRHKKQTGGAGQFGEVHLEVEPLERGAGFEFVDRTVGGSIPKPLIPAIEKGVRRALEHGFLAGYPLQDLRVTVTDGKHHPVDSKEIAFVTAGERAFRDAVAKARPTLLEPIVEIEVTVPNGCLGEVTGDLSTKRGRVVSTDFLGDDRAVVVAHAPQAELTAYPSQLKAMTAGRGVYAARPAGHEPVPDHAARSIIDTHRSAHHES
ncbi:MAG: elongation factor G [Planctomycetota bacterium]